MQSMCHLVYWIKLLSQKEVCLMVESQMSTTQCGRCPGRQRNFLPLQKQTILVCQPGWEVVSTLLTVLQYRGGGGGVGGGGRGETHVTGTLAQVAGICLLDLTLPDLRQGASLGASFFSSVKWK